MVVGRSRLDHDDGTIDVDPKKPWNIAAVDRYGLRSLTGRWPGGTIRSEAEVYSGYYTEAASASQPY